MKELIVSGQHVLLDDADYARFAGYRWGINHWGYVVRYEGNSRDGTQRCIYLHREILEVPDGAEVDHRNTIKTDNQRHNLRRTDRLGNSRNVPKHKGTSRFKGVFFFKRDGNWAAQIKYEGKRRHLGYFANEEDAARAYNRAAEKHFGAFAWLNPVSKGGETARHQNRR